MKNWHKEPFLHFLIIGALIFVLFSMVNKEKDVVSIKKIVVSADDIGMLSRRWSKTWRRTPTETELKGLVESYIREEVFYREAVSLGLDQDDAVLRRRLMQKMEFLSNDLAELRTPDKKELSQYFLDHLQNYQQPPRITFTHIYFSQAKRGSSALKDAKQVLSGIIERGVLEDGDGFMLQYDFAQKTPTEVADVFGKAFAGKIFLLGTNGWQGPVESEYGFHLVQIQEKMAAQIPEFATVADQVRDDWMFEQRKKTNNKIYEKFKNQYEIIIEDFPNRTDLTQTAMTGGEAS